MTRYILVKHAPGAPGFRLLGLGPNLLPSLGLKKLQFLLNRYTFWAKNRTQSSLREMLKNSSVVISLWKGQDLVGFGRATTDGIFRTVIWDVVVADNLQGNGYGRMIVKALLNCPSIIKSEKIYLMTTNSADFYGQLGFNVNNNQQLMCINNTKN